MILAIIKMAVYQLRTASVCSAEGEKLLEDCPQKIASSQNIFKNTLDEKKQNS